MAQSKRTWKTRFVEVLVVLGIVAVMAVLLQPADLNWHHPSQKSIIECSVRLQFLAAATVRYAQAHGTFPDDPKDCVDIRALSAQNLFCPASDLEPGKPRTDLAGAALDAGEPMSYIYVGRGVTTSASADVPIWIEPLGDHKSYGGNVAYADGHVSWETAFVVQSFLNQAVAGKRPIRFPEGSTTQP